MSSSDSKGAESGAATVVATGVVLAAAILALVLADIGVVLRARTEAATAADAAALAAAPLTFLDTGVAPTEEAERFAARNGAALVSCSCRVDRSWNPRTIAVVVETRAETLLAGGVELVVSSRAEFAPTELFAGG